ncbi:helix-turn-helix domain-containing protein [Streptomyces sp. NPDC052051]|uniref:TetR/AcrR family transcriptional regulator n=1 Tax=Streptomyces sp. NPDC052051 TaxID=3154649 RepID=UPI003440B9A9
MSAPKTPTARRRDAASSISRIITAARKLASRSPSIEEVAQSAGVGVATVYRHFGTRERLLQAVAAREVSDALAPHVTDALADPSPRDGLHRLSLHLVRLAIREAQTTRHETSALAAIVTEVTTRYGTDIEGLLSRAQKAGEIRDDIDAGDITPLLGATLVGLAFPAGGLAAQERYIALTFEALRPEGANPLPPRSRT